VHRRTVAILPGRATGPALALSGPLRGQVEGFSP